MKPEDKKRLEEIREYKTIFPMGGYAASSNDMEFLLRLLNEERGEKERLHYALDLIVLNEKVTPEISELAFNATHRGGASKERRTFYGREKILCWV